MIIVILFISFLSTLLCAFIIRLSGGREYFSKVYFWSGYFFCFATFLPFYFVFPDNTDLEMAHVLTPMLVAVIANLGQTIMRVKKERTKSATPNT